jgi:hypothetical protein
MQEHGGLHKIEPKCTAFIPRRGPMTRDAAILFFEARGDAPAAIALNTHQVETTWVDAQLLSEACARGMGLPDLGSGRAGLARC